MRPPAASKARDRRSAVAVGVCLILAAPLAGCTALLRDNRDAWLREPARVRDDPTWLVMFKAGVLVPARDILTLEPLWRPLLRHGQAWNIDPDGRVPPGSFWQPRSRRDLEPAALARGWGAGPPREPLELLKPKRRRDGRVALLMRDADGRRFLVKPDAPEYPELGSTAALVGARVMWALGYNVPETYIVRIANTGLADLDGRRAAAVAFLDNVRGHWHFDWFRYRRELRALRLASAWINDVDRVGSNTLVVADGEVLRYYLIDFDSCLGSWQGRPKEPWRGYRYEWTPWLSPQGHPQLEPISPALGRWAADFDPWRWRPQVPNNAFDHMTREDAAWIARQIARLDEPRLRAIISAARLSRPADAERLLEILMRRRQLVLAAAGGR